MGKKTYAEALSETVAKDAGEAWKEQTLNGRGKGKGQ
jgi:hypothetical protein